MIGWMLVFVMLSTAALLEGAVNDLGAPAVSAALVFGVLLIVSALTRVFRGYA
jgi:hypothetical protein